MRTAVDWYRLLYFVALVSVLGCAGEPSGPTSAGSNPIAFVSDRDAGNEEIYVMNADGSGPIRLTNHAGRDFNPVWSPTGAKIAFISDRDGNLEIYVMNANGTGAVNLTNNGAPDGIASWVPLP